MPSSITPITATKDLATCDAVPLSGPTKLVAEGMVTADEVLVYEETVTEGNYQPVPRTNGRAICLESCMQSIIFEGYGNYKFLLGPNTSDSLLIGYSSGE